jgi:hypothetical protein
MSEPVNAGTNTTDTGTTVAATSAQASTTAAVDQTTTQQQQAATAPAGDKPADTKADDKPNDAPRAPEKYEFKAPENGQLNPAVMAEFEGIAKELDLPQDQAQKLIDKMGPKIASAQMEQIQKVQGEWEASAKVDKEFGGEKLQENLAVAKKAIETFGTPELKTLLNESGLGNHPEVIRAFYRAGRAISEDKPVPGGAGQGPTAGNDLASRMYPNHPKN